MFTYLDLWGGDPVLKLEFSVMCAEFSVMCAGAANVSVDFFMFFLITG